MERICDSVCASFVLEIIVGISLIYRSPKDIICVENYIKNDQIKIKSHEIPRMEKVMKNFVVYRYVEIVLIFIWAILYFASPNSYFWRCFGLGLLIQASILPTIDYFAERRGFIYLEYLNSISHE